MLVVGGRLPLAEEATKAIAERTPVILDDTVAIELANAPSLNTSYPFKSLAEPLQFNPNEVVVTSASITTSGIDEATDAATAPFPSTNLQDNTASVTAKIARAQKMSALVLSRVPRDED